MANTVESVFAIAFLFYIKLSYFSKSRIDIYKKESDSLQERKNGLSINEVLMSREKHGANRLKEYKRKSFFKCFLSNLSDPIIKVLIGALFINIIFISNTL